MTTTITDLKPIFHSMKFNTENTQALFSFLQKQDLKISDVLYPEKSKIKGNQEAYQFMIDLPLFKKDIFDKCYPNNNTMKNSIELDLELKKTNNVKKIKI